ncbi:MAG: ethanolamine ammonia-lyase reactivating factor EutA, partial [Actinomycetes bacterium]
LTPYRDAGDAIDVAAVADTVCRSYQQAGLSGSDIDTGAVLLTGTALARPNARALAERLAGDSGRFVCAAAGHHLEAVLAAHGSGAVERSAADGGPVVNVDIGGGTTKLALVVDGEVQATAALAVGSRLVAWDARGRLTRVESSVVPLCRSLGIAVGPGRAVPEPALDELCGHLARAVVRQLGARRVTRRAVTDPSVDLLLTAPFPRVPGPSAIVLSGGVAEYIDQPQGGAGEGDLGPFLARALVAQLRAGGLGDQLRPARERIRATVIGASQFSTQVSGSTVRIGDGAALPVHNVPVVRLVVGPHETVEPATVATALRRAIAERAADLRDRRAVAVAIA